MRFIAVVALLFVGGVLHAQETPPSKKKAEKPRIPANAIPGYTVKKLEGFHLLVSDETAKHFDDKLERKPMDVLELELKGICRVMPPRMLKVLQTVAVFVEWDDPEARPAGTNGVVVARYWYDSGNGLGMLRGGRNPLKANNIEVLSMKYLTEKWQPGKTNEQIIILHELSHAVHNHLVGGRNPAVQAAYRQAMDRSLYEQVKHSSGRTERAYAATSDHEYFAELSCAYLDKCAYFPFTREELKEHDPIGYKLMEQVWGKADNRSAKAKLTTVAAVKPPAASESKPATTPAVGDSESLAEQKLELIDILIKSGKTDKARERLGDLIKAYPMTKAAKKAQELLNSLK
jgi:hypothetical protein